MGVCSEVFQSGQSWCLINESEAERDRLTVVSHDDPSPDKHQTIKYSVFHYCSSCQEREASVNHHINGA